MLVSEWRSLTSGRFHSLIIFYHFSVHIFPILRISITMSTVGCQRSSVHRWRYPINVDMEILVIKNVRSVSDRKEKVRFESKTQTCGLQLIKSHPFYRPPRVMLRLAQSYTPSGRYTNRLATQDSVPPFPSPGQRQQIQKPNTAGAGKGKNLVIAERVFFSIL